MNLDEAGRLQEAWKTTHGDRPCNHTRIVDRLLTEDGQSTEKLACRECGAIHLDPLRSLPDSPPPQ